jgi:hypothetical protein
MALLAGLIALAMQLREDDPNVPAGHGGSAGSTGDTNGDTTGPPAGDGTEDAAPLTWTARSHLWLAGCDHRYLVDSDPLEVPAPPVAQDAESWAADQGAVHGGQAIIEATLRPAGQEPVVVEALHIRVADRAEPLPWNAYAMDLGCGGSLSVAAYRVDLDEARPLAVPADGYDAETGEVLTAPRLPYQVTAAEPLSLRVEAAAVDCDCTWYIEVEWSSGTERGMLRIDDEGRPFRTSGIENDTVYVYPEESWVPEAR